MTNFVLTYNQALLLDSLALEDGLQVIELMETAALKSVECILQKFPLQQNFCIFCGVNNNGGDGLAIARLLVQQGKSVQVFIVGDILKMTNACYHNYKLLPENIEPIFIKNIQDIDIKLKDFFMIDAIFGVGLKGHLKPEYFYIFDVVNNIESYKISIDVPSGLPESDLSSTFKAIQADLIITFQCPKLNFFFSENAAYVKAVEVLDIGLEKYVNILNGQQVLAEVLTKDFVKKMLPVRPKFGHKGHFGKVLLYAGSKGMMGAAVLCSKSILTSGAGLLTVFIPQCGLDILQISIPEAVVQCDVSENFLTNCIDTHSFNVVASGPGLGQDVGAQWLENLLNAESQPAFMVLDADALNLLSQNPNFFTILPKHTILTPHVKEFKRLIQKEGGDSSYLLAEQVKFAQNFHVNLVLKGHYTKIVSSNGKIFINITGNVGMAKGGSGDVLTGMISGFLAQNKNPLEAALIGVYLHGLCGDIAQNRLSEYCILASDIIDALPTAIQSVLSETTILN